jgi:hypothetical protein
MYQTISFEATNEAYSMLCTCISTLLFFPLNIMGLFVFFTIPLFPAYRTLAVKISLNEEISAYNVCSTVYNNSCAMFASFLVIRVIN